MTSLKRALASQHDNLSSKIYVRSTRSGKVRKVVREVYLRDDIPCSSRLCQSCFTNAPRDSHDQAVPFILSERPAGTSKYKHGHYLVPDTNAFLSGMDVFEASNAFHDVIVLQTVLEEVKNRSLPIYNRLISLSKNEDKRYYVFFNDFRRETYVLREQSETINDRNDRAVRMATAWYEKHLKKAVKHSQKAEKAPKVVMLSNDRENVRKAKEEGIEAVSLYGYVESLEGGKRLLDMISEVSIRGTRQAKAEQVYPKYLSESKLKTGIANGTLHDGVFSVSTYNYLEGSVRVDAFERPLLVLGRENGNRATTGDRVVIELLPKDQWKEPSSKVIEEDTINRNDNAEAGEDEGVITQQERRALQDEVKKTHKQSKEGRAEPTAKVVGVLKRNWRQYVGHIDRNSAQSSSKYNRSQQAVFFRPMDKRIPKIRIRTRLASELLGKRLVAVIDAWDEDSRYPMGHIYKDLGDLEAKGAETEGVLMEYDVQYRPFPKAVLDCLPAEGHDWKVPASKDDPGWKGRRDLRDLFICSIDPPGCVDIDDALHAKRLPNGNFEVGVHIADVSNFVKPNNAMDAEASARGTTVYLVDKRIDMLPPLLGTDLCSLQPYVERYAFSVIWEITQNAEILSSSFTKSVIRSREKFSYENAQKRIDDKSQNDELTQGMRFLMALSKKLKQRRVAAGALTLSSPEVRVHAEADSETSDPMDIETKQMLDTNSLVEEMMLLANTSVASKIQENFSQTALLRRHPTPPKNFFEELQNQLKVRKGMELRIDSSKALADSLDKCVDSKAPFFNTLVRILATRCMTAAEYFPAGNQAYPDYRHYGIATEIYTHFTSPIRRYADLVVHRQLAAAIGYEHPDASIHSKDKLDAICKNINIRHRNAQFAGRASIEYYVGQALKGRVIDEEGYIMRVFSNGIVVFVPRFGIEGLIRLRDMAEPGPESVLDSDNYTLALSGSKDETLALFQRVKVKIYDELEQSTGKRKVKLALLRSYH